MSPNDQATPTTVECASDVMSDLLQGTSHPIRKREGGVVTIGEEASVG